MSRISCAVALVLAATVTGTVSCRDSSERVAASGEYQPVLDVLRPFIRHEMADKDLPAVSIALVDGNDLAWADGFGFANPDDSTPATAETLYRVGSIAKLVTAIGVMQMVEKGQLELDAPVSRYLTDFHPVNRFGTAITVRHLLAHRSGLVRESPAGSDWDSSRASLADAVASLNQTELVFDPGTRTKYSDAGMSVAGELIERVRGQPFPGAVQGTVLDPMGLSHTTFTPDLSLDRGLARGFMWTSDGRMSPAPRFDVAEAPTAGLYSTAIDLGHLVSVLLNGGATRRGQLLKKETLAGMWAGIGDTVAGRDFGLGFRVSTRDGVRRIGHGSAFGGNSTALTIIPDERLGAVVIANKDAATAVTTRIADAALSLMRAAKHHQPMPALTTTTALDPALARRLDGTWAPNVRRSSRTAPAAMTVVLEERNGKLFFHRRDAEPWLEVKQLGDTLVTDDRLGFGTRITRQGQALIVGADTLWRTDQKKPAAAPDNLKGLVGEYGPGFNIVYAREENGQLHLLMHYFFDYPLTQEAPGQFRFPDRGLYAGEPVRFDVGPDGKGKALSIGGVPLERRSIAPEDGSTFKITPLRPADELTKEALAATPPTESGEFLPPDLVEVARLDPTVKLDMRYATTNNFVSTAFYRQPRAFMQRPAAEALVRANRKLHQLGYGLLIHDSYRPWYVTKMFWDATPADQRVFVANPAQGSRHNRGCAVDLTLYDLRTGKPIEMVSGYDEFSDRAYPDYPGGTSLQRWHRKLLRRAMEAEGFTVFSAEWWHFDYKDWRKYPILNVRFEDIGGG